MRLVIFGLLVLFNWSVVISNSYGNENTDVMKTPPHFFNLGSTTSTSALSMQCEGDKPYKVINCIFSEINIRKSVDDTCPISQYIIQEVMHRVSKDRWDSETYGGGKRYIENDPTNNVLWKYTEITNDTPSKIITYTWDSPTKYSIESLGCKNIKFLGVNKDTLGIEEYKEQN